MNAGARELIGKLARYKPEDIDFTAHAKLQAQVRQLSLDEIRGNILNPAKLTYAERQPAKKAGEEKWNCYFKYSERQAHRYIIVINKNALIVTVIKINRRWQRRLDKSAKIRF